MKSNGGLYKRGLVVGLVLASGLTMTFQSASAGQGNNQQVVTTEATPPAVPAPAPTMEPIGLGADTALDQLASACFNGSMQACDDLYEAARQDPASLVTYTMYGDTCAGRQPRGTGLLCADVFVDGPALGQPVGPTTTVEVVAPTDTATLPPPTTPGAPALDQISGSDTLELGEGCPTGTFEGVYRWNQMRPLYRCMLPFVENFFQQTYGANWQPPAAYNYVSFDETMAHGCRGPEGDEPDLGMTVYAYCPEDNEVYLGAAELWHYYAYAGDVGPMAALAHELGHHLQALYIPEHNETQLERIAAENQADCVAGAWMRHVYMAGMLEEDDALNIDVLLRAIASAEDNFGRTHGTLDERVESFNTGYQQGIEACNGIYLPITGDEQVITVSPDDGAGDVSSTPAPVTDESVAQDCASGQITASCAPVQVGGTSLPAPASCEAALSTEECNEVFAVAYERWGANLPCLFGTADRNLTLGYFITQVRSQVNGFALLACVRVATNENGQQAGQDQWFELTSEVWPDVHPSAFGPMFDNSMSLVCPDLRWTPVYGATGTGTETTTDMSAGATAIISGLVDGVSVEQAYTCSDIAFVPALENVTADDDINEATVCNEDAQRVFSSIVANSATGFNDYVYSGVLGAFSGMDYSVPDTAFVGFWACFHASVLASDVMGYTSFIQTVFPNTSSMDANAAWESAFTYLCPGMRPAV